MQPQNYNNRPAQYSGGAQNEKVGVPFMEILMKTLSNWPWLVLSIIVCCGLGVLYLLRTPNTYSQSAVLVIKDDEEGGSAARDLSSIGLFQNNSNLQNEVATLKSPDLMQDVVEELNLDYSYSLPGVFHDKIAYGSNLPLTVNIPGLPDNKTASFQINVERNGDVTLSHLRVWTKGTEKEYDGKYKGKLSSPFRTPLGEVTVTPTKYYNKSKKVELLVNKLTTFSTVEAYCSRLKVEPDEDGGTVITLTLNDGSVERADDILSALIKVYRENWIEDKNQMAVATSNFINERLKVIEKELGNVDSDISEYKSANLVPDVEQAAQNYMKQNQELSDEILELTSELQMARHIRDYVTAPNNKDALLPSNVGMVKNSISSAIDAYNKRLIERNDLASKSSDQNPLVVNMDADLAGMRSAIIGNIDNSIVNLKTQIAGLQGARSETRTKISTTPTQAKFLLSVERQQKVKENLYLFLLQKREDNEIEQAFTAQNFRLIQRPGGSDRPVSPHRKMVMMMAFALGLVIPFGYQYLKATNDTKIHDRSDVASLKMPMLGEIPLYKGKEDSEKDILVKPAMRDVINESFRVLRTNIDFVKPDKKGQAFTLAITSINPGSGKSFIAINIGTAIAIRNNRVLVIDADLRRGSSSVYAGSPKKGLSDYLAGRVTDVNSLIVKPLGKNGPDVLPIGSIPPNPTELIETPLFGEMMEELKKEYDYIICDCPPIEIVADTRIIDKYVDRTVFVIRAGLLDKALIPEIDSLYTSKQYANMVYILNGTKSSSHYGYGKNRYGYGYGYGYGHIEKNRGKLDSES
ncbi:MAG: polysaccharide biosynthesis tyrosine autokinase [Muribaculaceae bacterium]|nr:polysaccharide biosynthesis tyrosine autokinase [Muribaculaceae bacterium]